MKVIIAAGGKGTRIQSIAPDIPKPLIPMDGVPVLEREIRSLAGQGFTDIILTVSYQHEKIKKYFGDGSTFGVDIRYFVEESPLGNAGALFKLNLSEDFMVLIADALFDIDFNRFVNFHKEKGGIATLFTHPNSHPYDSSVLVTDKDGAVTAWLMKEDERPVYYKNRVNAGMHILSPEALKLSDIDSDAIGTEVDGKRVKVDMDRDLLRPLCRTGRMFCYDSPEYCRDMGTPERFEQAVRDLQYGVVGAKNLHHRQKAIFLDRDGTINRHIGFLRSTSQFELLPGAAEAVRRINSSGYLAIVVTNQPIIARGEASWEDLEEIHNKMETELGKAGAYLDAIYFCPHHPDKGFEGEVPELKIECDCRKPRPGMILRAAEKFNIDLGKSWMIGDDRKDIGAGKAAGCRTVLIGTDKYDQDMNSTSLLSAVEAILSQ